MIVTVTPEQVRAILWDFGTAVAIGTAFGILVASYAIEIVRAIGRIIHERTKRP